MELEMFELYKQLDLNNQRNELSLLLIKIDKLLDTLLVKTNLSGFKSAKNYDSSENANMEEKEVLEFFYEDLWNIKNKLLTLLIMGDKNE